MLIPPIQPPAPVANPTVPVSVAILPTPVPQALTERPTIAPDREKFKMRDRDRRQQREEKDEKPGSETAHQQGRGLQADILV